jgi:O-antigen/teichoic acid export membrane protein
MNTRELLQKLSGKGDKDLGEIVKGGMFAFGYRVFTMSISYALIILISKQLGKEGMGVWNLCMATLNILVMLGCLGFNTSIVRFVSEYRAKEWNDLIRRLYGNLIKYAGLSGTVLGVGLILGSDLLAERYFKDPVMSMPLKITGIILPLVVTSTINVEFIRGLKRIQISEFFRTLILQLVALIGTAILSFSELRVIDPLIYYALGALLAVIGTSTFIWRFLKGLSFSENIPEMAPPVFSFKSHFLISLPMILTSFIQLLNGRVDLLMLGYFADTGVAGVFGMAFKLSIITNFVIGALKAIAMPKISELFWSQKTKELKRVVHFSTLLIFGFALPVSLALFFFPEFILSLIDEEFTDGSNVLRIFAVMQLINSGSGMVAVFLNMSGNQLFFTKLVAFTTTLNIVLNLILIPRYGMEGAAIATLISNATWNLVGVRFIYKKYRISTFFNPIALLKRRG